MNSEAKWLAAAMNALDEFRHVIDASAPAVRRGDAAITLKALGIPAATLERLASGEWVAVPKRPTETMVLAGHRQIDWCRSDQATCNPDDPSQRPEGVGSSCGEDIADAYRAMLAAATEAGSHDD